MAIENPSRPIPSRYGISLSLCLSLSPSPSLSFARSLCKAINRGAVMDRHWIDKDEAIITTMLTITTEMDNDNQVDNKEELNKR